jgi:hypothetical protein|tara:strand:- start:180 stop:515 length:336 start_codon:yes stop_codon:yes gene_type:complete
MIKKLVTITALAMLLGSPISYADIITGNGLVTMCEARDKGVSDGFCSGYIAGVSLLMTWALPDFRICPDGSTLRQHESIVRKFLKENPEELHKRADMLVIFALAPVFPCPD